MAKTMESDEDNISMRSGKRFAKTESKEREKPQAKGAGRGISGLLKGIKGSETRNLGGDK